MYKAVMAYAWEFNDKLCKWAKPSRDQLEKDTPPTPEANIVQVAIIPSGQYRKLIKETKKKPTFTSLIVELSGELCEMSEEDRLLSVKMLLTVLKLNNTDMGEDNNLYTILNHLIDNEVKHVRKSMKKERTMHCKPRTPIEHRKNTSRS